MNKEDSEELDEVTMRLYLEQQLDPVARKRFRDIVAGNRALWEKWQRFRWDSAKGKPEYPELQEYFGDTFVEYFDSSWALAEEWTHRAPTAKEDIERFYQQVPYYVYNLAIWEASGQRPNYVQKALPYLGKHQSRSIVDFGCGIGTDGIKLLQHGYQVIFYDFDNPSTQFLHWRLDKRGIPAAILHPPCDPVTFPQFDTLWAMDVLEHLPEPEQTLAPLLQKSRVFIFDTEDEGQAGGRHPFHMNRSADCLEELLRAYGFEVDHSAEDINVWCKVFHSL